ncbi:MAG: hybrid sensor histidine kinase/response regulator [Leptolyngbyaceae cyanobacterium CSU_1_3]|nr:hybrid sensor histidine kinase/response regulator [Leptolyngbyaceae cyanobacterium CSU_1_3]
MSHDKELEIRHQFLDEAQEYLDTLDLALIGLADNRVDTQKINAALRAVHSIKGGAGMMGFEMLSNLAHRLEDSFKVLKVDRSIAIEPHLENLLLRAVDCLRQVIESDRHNRSLDTRWLNSEINPLFEQLHAQLGDPQDESATSMLSPEEGQDIIPMLFETEVEGCLQRLESVLETPNQPCLQEELAILAQELGGLGEMLQLSAFTSLCESVTLCLEAGDHDMTTIAQTALQSWRRAQALAMVGQYAEIPTRISLMATGQSQKGDEPTIPAAAFNWEEDRQTEAISSEAPLPAWYTEALASDTVAVDDHGYAEFQPTAEWTRSTVRDAQVSNFKVPETQADEESPVEEDQSTVRVPVRQLNQLNDFFGELTIDRNGLDLYLKRLRSLSQLLHDRVQTLNKANAQMRNAYDKVTLSDFNSPILNNRSKLLEGSFENGNANESLINIQSLSNKAQNSEFDALELDRYSDLHLLSQQVMETIVQLQEVSEDIDLSLDDTEQVHRNLNKTAKQLQSGLSQLRMRPLSDIVDRFPRALRELSLQHKKQVNLKVSGGNTLIDRNILETLSDPLMHLLRNAFDHGIEKAETRLSRGKEAEGTIEIRAFHQGSRTVITVRDDGEGIAIAKIRARAEQMGLDSTLLSAASDEELLSLIFEPGFTTSNQVTTLSGRGVGMDVVRSNLKQIRGEIKVNTQPEIGTTFTLSIPFTLSTVRVLLVESYGMLLAFPTDIIEEMFLLKPEQVIRAAGSEVLNWQNQAVELIRLQNWLHFNCPRSRHSFESVPTIASASVVIVNQGTQKVGLHIDRCWGEQEATIRRVEGNLPLPAGFSNCTIMGNGRVVPLVNVAEMLRWMTSYERSQAGIAHSTSGLRTLQAAPRDAVSPTAAQPQTILVVDDSINVRRFLALTLERAGYRVEQAKDGLDALERLETGSMVQAVICDIEMPRLDGYGLLAKMKANPELEQVPIAMLTSRSSDKHRQLATNLGANAYFSKPYNEQVLLRTLAQMMELATV